MLAALADLVLPRRCAGCRAGGSVLCPSCQPAGATLRVHAGTVPVLAAGVYEHGLRAAVLAYKERGRRDLAGPLAALLARAVRGHPLGGAVLVPVPSAGAAARRRGGDHMLRLARLAGRRLGVPVRPALRLCRAVHDSAGLDVTQRRANLHGALGCHSPPRGGVAIVVDDVVTTGATLDEAVRALRAAGWAVGGAAVVAATPRRHPVKARFGTGSEATVRSDLERPAPGTRANSRLALS